MSWIEVVGLARQLQETAASQREIDPADVERLVRMLLRFNEQLTRPLLSPKQS